MIFKYSEFKKFIYHMKSLGNVIPLGQWNFSNVILLRHDVDFDIDAAYQLSLIEAECDIRSTFFFLTTCHTYNLFSALNRKKLCEMANAGFEIGLHFDPTIYGDASIDQLAAFVDQEAEMLSLITGQPVKSVSLHNPSVHGQYPMFEKYLNAYDKRIFSDALYLSDSRMDFRGKNPFTFAEKVKDHPIQILLHPMHYSENGFGYPDIIHERIKSYIDSIDNLFRENSTYVKQISNTDLNSYIVKKGRE